MTDEERRALIKEKAGADFVLRRNGKVVRSRKTRTYYTVGEWEEHLDDQKRRLELRLKSASTNAERARIRDELRVNAIMRKFTDADK